MKSALSSHEMSFIRKRDFMRGRENFHDRKGDDAL